MSNLYETKVFARRDIIVEMIDDRRKVSTVLIFFFFFKQPESRARYSQSTIIAECQINYSPVEPLMCG